MAPRYFLLLPLFGAALIVGSCATGWIAKTSTSEAVGRKLDLNSFPNSTGPRREPGKHTPEQYGFTEITSKGDIASFAKPDGSWTIYLKVLSRPPGHILALFTDQAGGNQGPAHMYGNYDEQETVYLTLGGDGLYKAIEKRESH